MFFKHSRAGVVCDRILIRMNNDTNLGDGNSHSQNTEPTQPAQTFAKPANINKAYLKLHRKPLLTVFRTKYSPAKHHENQYKNICFYMKSDVHLSGLQR